MEAIAIFRRDVLQMRQSLLLTASPGTKDKLYKTPPVFLPGFWTIFKKMVYFWAFLIPIDIDN